MGINNYHLSEIDEERRQADRRNPNQRTRTSNDKKVFYHEIGNDPDVDINNPSRLEFLSDVSTMTEVFERDNLMIKRFKNWAVTLKHAPFSEKDLMIIYTGKSSKLTNINGLKGNGVVKELFEILQELLININGEKSKILNPDKEELCIGNNITIKPGSGEAQSLREPHIHFTIFPTVEGVKNNVQTLINTLGEHKNVFPLNKVNLTLIRLLESHLNTEGIETKRRISLDNQDNLALEIELGNKDFFLGNSNYILCIYKEIHKFNKSINIGTLNNLLKKIDPEFEHHRISHSIGFGYKDGNILMRIRYSYRNKTLGERGGSAANWLHIVSRKAGIPSPNLSQFKEYIMEILK